MKLKVFIEIDYTVDKNELDTIHGKKPTAKQIMDATKEDMEDIEILSNLLQKGYKVRVGKQTMIKKIHT